MRQDLMIDKLLYLIPQKFSNSILKKYDEKFNELEQQGIKVRVKSVCNKIM